MAESRFSAQPLAVGSRIACRIEYDGSAYSGWQSQPQPTVLTVQDTLEAALACVAAAPVRVHCAGRTDTGVHAVSQIVHFEAPAERAEKAWVLGTNTQLPRDVRVHWAVSVAQDFHARFSARSRRYRYIITDLPIRPPLLLGKLCWHRQPLNAGAMHEAGQALLGEHDFSAFRAASCQSSSPMRNVESISVSRWGELIVIEVCANAFLHHMVRNIAGSLIAVGDGRSSTSWIGELLAGRDRTVAADTAPPDGLYLVDVDYPPEFGLPKTPFGPLLLGPER
ncbi:MAG: tRNA pseudouridine38-40 synthase [Bacteroidia bacterium]